ncbi:MAG: phosphodiester glycosidase family protein, partial [Candidatus Sericytochromatia bacterium]
FISENKFKYELNVLKGYNPITDIKTYSDNTEQKVVLELSMPFVFDTEKTNSYYKVTIPGSNPVNLELLKKQLETFSSDFKKIDVDTSKSGITNIIFYTKTPVEFVNTYTLSKPERLVIHFPQIYNSEYREKKSDGLYLSTIKKGTYNGPLRINTLEVSPNKFNIRPMLAKEPEVNNMTLKELSRLSKDYRAKASINGGYFSTKTKTPLGLVYLNGENVTPPIYNRTALMIKKDGTFDIKNIDLNISLKYSLPDTTTKLVKIHTFNQVPQNHQIVLFTDKFGKLDFLEKKTTDEKETKEVKKEENNYLLVSYSKDSNLLTKINSISDLKNSDYLLYATGSGKTTLEKVLDETNTSEIKFDYSEPLEQTVHALGGGPRLIRDGVIDITSEMEKFKPDITQGRAPRTALGILDTGKIIMIAIDGRQDSSVGMTLEELAEFLQKLGSTQAINFDGGGSTAMFFDDTLINKPSDPQERKISTGIF